MLWTFKSVAFKQSQLPSVMWVGLIQSFEGLENKDRFLNVEDILKTTNQKPCWSCQPVALWNSNSSLQHQLWSQSPASPVNFRLASHHVTGANSLNKNKPYIYLQRKPAILTGALASQERSAGSHFYVRFRESQMAVPGVTLACLASGCKSL